MADALPSAMSKDQDAATIPAHVQSMHRQTQAAPVAHQQTGDDSPNITSLLGNLSEDIYAMSVAAIVKGKRGFQLFQILLGFLVTAGLQLGLLMMVWSVMVTPPGDVGNIETRLLWTQAGQLQGQLCWIKAVLDQNGLNQTDAMVNCSLAWPVSTPDQDQDPEFLEFDVADYGAGTSTGPIQCPGFRLRNVTQWEGAYGAKQCLLLYMDKPIKHYWSSLMLSQDLGNCTQVLKDMDDNLKAFGLGMLYSERNLSTRLVRYNGTFYRGLHQSRSMTNGGWLLHSNNCVPDPSGYVARQRANAHSHVCNFPEQAGSHAQCIGSVDLPTFDPDVSALVVNALAFMALAVFAHDELRRAASLCHVAAAACSCLPEFYAPNEIKQLQTPHLCWGLRLVVLAAPMLQLCVAVLVLLTGGAISLSQEEQSSQIQVILNSVALGFILDVDNRIGAMIRSQQTHCAWANATETDALDADVPSLARHVAWRSVCATSAARRFLGHAYVAFLGLLLTIEPVLLSPTVSVLILLGSLARQYNNVADVANVLVKLATRSTWGSYVLSTSAFLHIIGHKVCEGNSAAKSQCMSALAEHLGGWGSSAIFYSKLYFTLGYFCTVVCIVLLLFYRPLPTVAFRWAPTLLALQVIAAAATLIVLVLQFYSFNLLTGSYLCVTWLCMFVIWPTCHKQNDSNIAIEQPYCTCACCA